MQETFLFSETLANNIRFGRPEAPRKKRSKLPRGRRRRRSLFYKPRRAMTRLWASGGSGAFPGGQKQRVALARAILYDPAILVLDDATSAVDMETEEEIQTALAQVLKGRTTFIIAQPHLLGAQGRPDHCAGRWAHCRAGYFIRHCLRAADCMPPFTGTRCAAWSRRKRRVMKHDAASQFG